MRNWIFPTSAGLSATLLSACATVAEPPATPAPRDQPARENVWFDAGQSAIQEKLDRLPETGRARNVILLIADGNGVATNYATRIYQGQQAGGYGDENVMAKEALPYLALSKTYNTNAQTPDSAGTAVAMNTGIKTKSGVIGVDETLRRGECDDVEGASIEAFGETMSDMGKSVGVVTTARVTHATPAAVYAHAADRDFEDDSALPEGCSVPDIALQLLDSMSSGGVDFAIGGGRRHFLPEAIEDEEGSAGKRLDGRNLVDEAVAAGVQYAWNDASFDALSLDGSAPVLGLFESSHMLYEHDREDEPSLSDMTAAAIDYLATNEAGYYLMVEGGRVDHANHDGNAFRTMTDGVAFDEAVATALQKTDSSDTLVIVTADHGHAMAFNGYCGRGSPIGGLCYEIDDAGEVHLGSPSIADDGKTYTTIGYLNGLGSIVKEQPDGSFGATRHGMSQADATDPDYLQQALIPLDSETHSPADVAICARGPWAHLVDGTVEQNYIYHVMRHAAMAE